GAFLNGEQIHVSDTIDPIKAVASIGFPTNCQLDAPDVIAFLKAVPHTQAIRRTGSASLNMAFLAAGRIDAMWCHAINVWDLAAGLLLIEEAGGVVSAIDSSPYMLEPPSFIAASTKELHAKYLEIFSVDLL
ncbi:MAG: inositol monophosphatase family protein, partial [Thermoguttaceae bacterium]